MYERLKPLRIAQSVCATGTKQHHFWLRTVESSRVVIDEVDCVCEKGLDLLQGEQGQSIGNRVVKTPGV